MTKEVPSLNSYTLFPFDYKFVLNAFHPVRLLGVFFSSRLLFITSHGTRDRDRAVGRIDVSAGYFISQ